MELAIFSPKMGCFTPYLSVIHTTDKHRATFLLLSLLLLTFPVVLTFANTEGSAQAGTCNSADAGHCDGSPSLTTNTPASSTIISSSSTIETASPKYFAAQYHYNSGFNDKRTRWFYKVLRLAKEIGRAFVAPSFNVRIRNDTYAETFQPYEDFFDLNALSQYVPSISLASFKE